MSPRPRKTPANEETTPSDSTATKAKVSKSTKPSVDEVTEASAEAPKRRGRPRKVALDL
jgi:hypothetical protein